MTDFKTKQRDVRVARAKAAIRRGETYYGTHKHQSAAVVIRDLIDMLKETVSELEFPTTATGENNG